MSFAAAPTREILWGVPPWAEILWYSLAVFSVLVFAYGVARPIAKYRRGDRTTLPPMKEIPRRVRTATRLVASQSTIRRRDPYVGWAHAGIFYGFVVLFIGTTILAINTDITERFFGWRFFKGDFYLGYSITLDVFGVALLLGLVAMMMRRAILRPSKLDYTRPDRAPDDQPERHRYRVGDWVFVGTLLYLVLGGYLLEGVRLEMGGVSDEAFSPFGWLAGQVIGVFGMDDSALGVVRRIVWWSHGLVALAFVASIPYTKATHMLTDFVSLVLRDPDARRRLQPIPEERAAEPAGYGALADFSAQHLLQLDACTKCGRCHAVCPAMATGRPLSPRDVVLELREQSRAAADADGIGGVLGGLLRTPRAASDGWDAPVVGDDGVHIDTLWSCMQCNACVEVCPVGIEQAPIINQLRRRLVEDGEVEPGVQTVLQTIHESGNSFGENKRKRGRWTRELDFEVKDARKEPVDVLWFVGDYASFDPRSQEVSRAVARLLHRAGVDFGILYDGERNSGNDVRRIGEEGLFDLLATENVAALADCDFQRIVTTDPHSLNTLRNEYPQVGGTWPVIHHTALLVELLESGRLGPLKPLGRRVTYHDPCHLGRMNGEYDNPRRILELLGCELVEMPRNRDNSFCCGAGGGRIWMADSAKGPRPSEDRIEEAMSLGELDHFVVTCPKDVTMYEDAIKTSGHEDAISLRELTELIEAALEPAGLEQVAVAGPEDRA